MKPWRLKELVSKFHFQVPDVPSWPGNEVGKSAQHWARIRFELLGEVVVRLQESVRAVYPDKPWIDVSAPMNLDAGRKGYAKRALQDHYEEELIWSFLI